jgi:transcriptional regulator with GAF, ATPase, and Fis domain
MRTLTNCDCTALTCNTEATLSKAPCFRWKALPKVWRSLRGRRSSCEVLTSRSSRRCRSNTHTMMALGLHAAFLSWHTTECWVHSISRVHAKRLSATQTQSCSRISPVRSPSQIENALAYREISQLKEKLAQEKLYLEEEIRSELNFDQIVGDSPALAQVLELVRTVAPSDSTVLLLGETGTGKELIARAIHDHSRRKNRTFVKLNCAALPTGLFESELFGHEKGAFTSAISQRSDGWNSPTRARCF